MISKAKFVAMVVVGGVMFVSAQTKPAATAPAKTTATAPRVAKTTGPKPKPATAPATKASTSTLSKTAAKPETKIAKPAAKPAMKQEAAKIEVAHKGPKPKPAPKAEEAKKPGDKKAAAGPSGKRDPFVSPITTVAGGSGEGVCNFGKRCVPINQINVMGIVKNGDHFVAVIENAKHTTYFLKDNDQVFNGHVTRITGDSVVFTESVIDQTGRVLNREVVKKMQAGDVGEGLSAKD